MQYYKRDDLEEISKGLEQLVEIAENGGNPQAPQINIEDAQEFISQYSPDSTVLKQAIFENVLFCLYCGIWRYNQPLDDMFRISEFIKLNHRARAETKLGP